MTLHVPAERYNVMCGHNIIYDMALSTEYKVTSYHKKR